MKNFIAILILSAAVFTANAQGPFLISGKKAQFTAPKGITANNDYLFPTFKTENTVYADDTTLLTIKNLETYVTVDSISATSWLILTNSSYILPGAKIFLHAASTGAAQTLYVKQGSYVVDTIIVSVSLNRTYVYNGTQFINVSNAVFPLHVANVTQASSITTAVAANGDAGVITTVSSTIAADDSSATFTFTNSFITASSVIHLTAGTAGNGCPYPVLVSQTAGSAVIRLYNVHRQAALNNTVKIHYEVKNK